MPQLSVYIPQDLYDRIRATYPNVSEVTRALFEGELAKIENPDAGFDLAFQLRMLAHRAERIQELAAR